MNKQNRSYLYALAAVGLWSTVATAFKIGLEHFSFSNLLLFSSFFSLVIITATITFQRNWTLLKHIKTKDLVFALSLGALNPFLYYILLFRAYDLLPAQQALALNYTWAIMIALMSVIVLKQKMNIRTGVALVLGFVGVVIIASKGEPSIMKFDDPLGVSLALSSSIVWALFWIYNTKSKIDNMMKLFLNFLSGSFFIFIYTVIFHGIDYITYKGILSTFYIGAFEMGITFIIWLKAMTMTDSTSKLSNLIFLSPFLSLIFINLFLKEKILISTIAGLTFIVFGIILQQYRK